MLAVLLLGERFTLSRGGSIVLGFAGVLVIMRPGLEAFQPAALAALGASFGYAVSNIATKKLDRLTKSKWDESSVSWSPDGSTIAFMSNHADDPDRDPSAQLYVAEAKPGVTEKLLTSPDNRASRSRPEWSPDGKWIAFLEGDEKKYGAYSMEHLMIVAGDGSAPPKRVASSEALDRGVSQPRWSEDGKLARPIESLVPPIGSQPPSAAANQMGRRQSHRRQ